MTKYRIQLLKYGEIIETYPVDSIDVAEVALKAQGLLVDNRQGATSWRIIDEIGRVVRDRPF